MKTKLFLCTLICAFFTISCKSQSLISKANILEGTWRIENKETYETWEKVNDNFEGKSYKIIDAQEKVSETLFIEEKEGKLVYKATVPNQNNGQAISFVLNPTNKEMLSFENISHDFPKKIQYKVINNDKLLVNVFGDNDQGFSYYLLRQ